MDYNPESAPDALDKAAQSRAVDAVLASGLVLAVVLCAFALILQLFPAWADAEPMPWYVWGPVAAVGAVHTVFQLHYLMRFMWGRGEWVAHGSPDWGDHENYLTSLLIVSVANVAAVFCASALHALLT